MAIWKIGGGGVQPPASSPSPPRTSMFACVHFLWLGDLFRHLLEQQQQQQQQQQ